MKTILLILTSAVLFMSAGCDKEELTTTWAQGVVRDIDTKEPVLDAKVYLMQLKNPQSGIPLFIKWEPIDSIFSDATGAFRFDYEADYDNARYGIYAKKEKYFEFRNVPSHSRQQKEEGVDFFLYPQSFIQIKVEDEPPYSGIDSILFANAVGEESIIVTGYPIDTTIIRKIQANTADIIGWYHIEEGFRTPFGAAMSCPSFDTCYLEHIF